MPIADTLNKLHGNFAELYTHCLEGVEETVLHLPDGIKTKALSIHETVIKNQTLFFYAMHAYHIYVGHMAFAVGFICGLACKVLPKIGITKLDINIPNTDQAKVQFSLIMTVSMLFLKVILRSFACGFVAGNYVGGQPKVQDAMKQAPIELATMVVNKMTSDSSTASTGEKRQVGNESKSA